MYLPRSLISKLYTHLQSTCHPLSPPVLILVALEPDALCGCRILTRLLKHDYIPHKIQPIAGYSDLEKAGKELVVPMMESQGGSGGVVVCLGVGGMVDLGPLLGLEPEGDESAYNGVEVWVIDAHRPWNLGNVFGGFPLEGSSEAGNSYQSRTPVGITGGQIGRAYKSGRGGIVAFDDGDIEEQLGTERDAYMTLVDMPDIDEEQDDLGILGDEEDDDSFESAPSRAGQKRKSWSDDHEDDLSDDEDRPHQRRRSNSVRTPKVDHLCDQANVAISQVQLIPLEDRHIEDSFPCEAPILVFPVTQSSPHQPHRNLRLHRRGLCDGDFYNYAKRKNLSCTSITRWALHSQNRFPP